MRRTDRLFELVQLFRGGRLHRGRDLAEALGVAVRTIYRDIDTLIASGIPIEGERGVGYVLREPIFLPPLTLTEAELQALHLGMAMVRRFADPESAGAASGLLAKIDAVLPTNRPRSGHRWGFEVYGAGAAARLVHLAELRRAVTRRDKLAITYRALDEALSERVIRPLQVEYWGRVWTCTAWCELRADFRAFRVDRIEACAPTGEQFRAEPGRTLADYQARISSET